MFTQASATRNSIIVVIVPRFDQIMYVIGQEECPDGHEECVLGQEECLLGQE